MSVCSDITVTGVPSILLLHVVYIWYTCEKMKLSKIRKDKESEIIKKSDRKKKL